MKSLVAIPFLCIFALVSLSGCQKSVENEPNEYSPSPNLPGAPLIPETSVLRPYFQTTLGNVDVGSAIGSAFAIELKGSDATVVLTALSILGESSGFKRQLLPEELTQVYKSCTLGSAFGGFDGVLSATGLVGIPDSAPNDQPSEAGDVLAITMPQKTRAGKFKLSSEQPVEGEKVWLSAAMFVGAPPSQRQHSAVVTGKDERGNFTYEFDNATLSHQGTVGAPVLNKKGEVIGIHLGGEMRDKKLTGFANPAARFASHMEKAVQAAESAVVK